MREIAGNYGVAFDENKLQRKQILVLDRETFQSRRELQPGLKLLFDKFSRWKGSKEHDDCIILEIEDFNKETILNAMGGSGQSYWIDTYGPLSQDTFSRVHNQYGGVPWYGMRSEDWKMRMLFVFFCPFVSFCICRRNASKSIRYHEWFN